MKRVFVDTSAWQSFANSADSRHRTVKKSLEAWEGRLVTTNFIFDELVTLLGRREGHHVARKMGDVLMDRGTVDLVRVQPEDEEQAWSYILRHADKVYSFTDCTSFILMRRLQIEVAITLDEDFRRAGFQVLPS